MHDPYTLLGRRVARAVTNHIHEHRVTAYAMAIAGDYLRRHYGVTRFVDVQHREIEADDGYHHKMRIADADTGEPLTGWAPAKPDLSTVPGWQEDWCQSEYLADVAFEATVELVDARYPVDEEYDLIGGGDPAAWLAAHGFPVPPEDATDCDLPGLREAVFACLELREKGGEDAVGQVR